MNKGIKNVLIVVAILLGLLIISSSIWGGSPGWMDNGVGGMGGFGFSGIGFIIMVAFWVVVIWGVVSLIRWFAATAGSNPIHQGTSALEILKQRYARGEINKEEFEQKKKDLGG